MAQTGQQTQGDGKIDIQITNLKTALKKYGDDYITILKQVISTDGPYGGHNDTRKLINSLKAEVIEVLNQLIVNIRDIGYLTDTVGFAFIGSGDINIQALNKRITEYMLSLGINQ